MDTNIIEQENKEENQEGTLTSAIQGEFKAAPWYVSSIAIHALAFLLLMLVPVDTPNHKTKQIIIISVPVEEVEEEKDKELDVTPEETPVIESNEVNPTTDAPIIVSSDFEISDHNETDNDMDSASAQGDPNANSTFDGDVTGTPTLMGVGNSGGSGGGGKFGTRFGGGRKNLVARSGGSPKTESAVDAALKWLAEHQESDGHWDCKKYDGASHDVAVTSMAVLAFLAAGNSTKRGKFKVNVDNAVKWLITQEKDGCIGPHSYTSAIGLMAIAEAYGMSMDSSLRPIAQRAVNWAVKTQCPSGGWDYSPNGGEKKRVDTSVTGWWVMGLKSARVAGLDVPSDTFENALKYIIKASKVNGSGSQATATIAYSSSSPTLEQVVAGGNGARLPAVALSCLQFLGKDRTDELVIAFANQTIKTLPIATKYDFYRTYYATLGLFQMGIKSEYWKQWNEPMKNSLLAGQVKVGEFKDKKGSWDANDDEMNKNWGRVGQTALGALMLTVYYRYDDVHRAKQQK